MFLFLFLLQWPSKVKQDPLFATLTGDERKDNVIITFQIITLFKTYDRVYTLHEHQLKRSA